MAITPTVVLDANDSVDRTAYTSASISPTANSLLVALAMSGIGAGSAPDAVPSGLGLTWNQLSCSPQAPATNARRITAYYAQCGASPGSGAITWTMVDRGSGTTSVGLAYVVLQITGHNSASPIAQCAGTFAATGNSVSNPMADQSNPQNRAFAVFGINTNEAITPGGSWTELADRTGSAPNWQFETQWLNASLGSGDPSASWSTSTAWRSIAFEVAALVASVNGSGVASLGGLSATALGVVVHIVNGSGVASFGGLSATVVGKRSTSGTAAVVFGGLSATANGRRAVGAIVDANLGRLTATVLGKRTTKATAGAVLGGLTAHAVAPTNVVGVAVAFFGFEAHAVGLVIEVMVGPYGTRFLTFDRETRVVDWQRATALLDDDGDRVTATTG